MIDSTECAFLLQAATDQVAAEARRPQPHETVHDLVRRSREASTKANDAVRSLLALRYPEIGWSDAEARPELQGQPREDATFWIYDPIDGAYHFLQGLPLWSASLTLISRGRPIYAAVYDPAGRELFCASEGHGTTVNGAAAHVSLKSDLRAAVVGTAVPPYGYGAPAEHTEAIDLLTAVSKRVFVVRQMASASLQLAYAATGRLDAYCEVGHDVHDWMAGALLVREAGGEVTDLAGAPFGWAASGIMAASSDISAGLLGHLLDEADRAAT